MEQKLTNVVGISDILPYLNMAKPNIGLIIILSSSPARQKSLNTSLARACCIRIGRCVMKSSSPTTSSLVTLEQETILRNMLMALLVFHKYIKNCRYVPSDFLRRAQLSALVSLTSKRYSKTFLSELLSIVVESSVLQTTMFYSTPKLISLQSSQSVRDIVESLMMHYYVHTELFINMQLDSEKHPQSVRRSLIPLIIDYLSQCVHQTTMPQEKCIRFIAPLRKDMVYG